MKKPVVFLSHSAKNKAQLLALRDLLNRKTNGFINFFLSCDGESIPLGTNWGERLVKALKDTKLMFVFVSRESLQSAWIPFEAGHAYGRGVHVVPYCLQGVALTELQPPLSLLQAHTLHSAADMKTLIQKCNSIFETNIAADFSKKEFDSVFGGGTRESVRPTLLNWTGTITEILVTYLDREGGCEDLMTMCRRRRLDCYNGKNIGSSRRLLHASGLTMCEGTDWFDDFQLERIKDGDKRKYVITLSPQLLSITLPLVDALRKKRKVKDSPEVEVVFKAGVGMEREPHCLTTKLYDSGIYVIENGIFGFRKMRFNLSDVVSHTPGPTRLSYFGGRNISDDPLGELITILVDREVLMLPNSLRKALARR